MNVNNLAFYIGKSSNRNVAIYSYNIADNAGTSKIIAFLLKFPQHTTVWLVSAGVFFMVRRTESWKMGIECFYLLAFTLSYAFGLYFTLPLNGA